MVGTQIVKSEWKTCIVLRRYLPNVVRICHEFGDVDAIGGLGRCGTAVLFGTAPFVVGVEVRFCMACNFFRREMRRARMLETTGGMSVTTQRGWHSFIVKLTIPNSLSVLCLQPIDWHIIFICTGLASLIRSAAGLRRGGIVIVF